MFNRKSACVQGRRRIIYLCAYRIKHVERVRVRVVVEKRAQTRTQHTLPRLHHAHAFNLHKRGTCVRVCVCQSAWETTKMATQCGGPVNNHHFVSSSGYYGYVPPAQTAASAPTQQQQHQQTMVNGHHHHHHQENGMDVDEGFDDTKMTMGQRMMMNGFGGRKRSFAGDELDIPQAYMPRFKRFREGENQSEVRWG